jgi:hypothetical protein
MKSKPEHAFAKVLETESLSDIALIKSILDPEGVRYFFQGENMMLVPQMASAILMVAEKDVTRTVELLRPLKLNYTRMVWNKPGT